MSESTCSKKDGIWRTGVCLFKKASPVLSRVGVWEGEGGLWPHPPYQVGAFFFPFWNLGVSLRIQSERREIRTKKTPNTDSSHAVRTITTGQSAALERKCRERKKITDWPHSPGCFWNKSVIVSVLSFLWWYSFPSLGIFFDKILWKRVIVIVIYISWKQLGNNTIVSAKFLGIIHPTRILLMLHTEIICHL